MPTIKIEDDSDCATCTERHKKTFKMLAEVKVGFLDNLQCPECGRSYSLAIEAEDQTT